MAKDWLEENGTAEEDWLAANAQPELSSEPYRVPSSGLFGLARGGTMEAAPQSTGFGPPEEEALQEPGLLDPLNWLPAERIAQLAVTGGRMAGGAAIRGVGSALSRVSPNLVRGAGGAALEMALEHLPLPARVAIRGAMAALRGGGQVAGKEAAGAAGRAVGQSAGALQPIVGGAEAQAYREGGQAGLDAMREAARQEGKTFVQGHTRPLPKPKPKGKVVGKIEPKVGSAESRVAKASTKKPTVRRSRAANEKAGGQMIPGELEARLRASANLTPEQQALVKQILDNGTPQEQMQVWQMLRQAGKH